MRRKLKWKNVIVAVLMAGALMVSVAGIYHESHRSGPVIKYTMTVKKGDTLWTLCDHIDNEMSTGYLVWLAMKQNHIHNAYELNPGQTITITLPEK